MVDGHRKGSWERGHCACENHHFRNFSITSIFKVRDRGHNFVVPAALPKRNLGAFYRSTMGASKTSSSCGMISLGGSKGAPLPPAWRFKKSPAGTFQRLNFRKKYGMHDPGARGLDGFVSRFERGERLWEGFYISCGGRSIESLWRDV